MDSPVFAQEPFTEREAYQWMIESAAWKNCRVRCGKYVLDVQRGQFAVSVRFIAERLGWHRAKVERFLTKLKTETLIETDARQGLTIITICNYNDSQDFNVNQNLQTETLTEEPPRQYRDSTETNKNTILTPDNTKKESTPLTPQGGKETVVEKPLKEKKAKSEPKATRLPEFFAVGPDETGEWPVPDFYTEFCESLGWTINETFDEALVFRDYWLAVPGPKGKKTDWEATWRNWIRRADGTKKEKARRQEHFLERTKPFERNHL
jgi:hypothetical protein